MQLRKKGFTIVELLIVIVVIAILAAITVVAFNGIRGRSLNSSRAAMVSSVQKSLDNYFTINGRFPGTTEIQGPSGAALLGLKVNNLDLPGNDSPGSAIRCIYPWSIEIGLCYLANDSSGYQCDPPTTCTQYELKYRDAANNLITVSGRRN